MTTDRVLRLGTRGSPLALAQSHGVAAALEAAHAGLRVEVVAIVTRGDREKGDLAPLGGKGLFTEELETGLLDGTFDLAVHSLKDLPVQLPDGLGIAAFPRREDPRDVLLTNGATSLGTLPQGATVLTGALRRRAQVLARRPDLNVEGIRGNVGTRIEKWRTRPDTALLLAAAGMARLGLAENDFGTEEVITPLDPAAMLPAPGQGILAIETACGSRAESLCRALAHDPTGLAADAERRVVAALGADCALPLAAFAHATELPGTVRLQARVLTPDGNRTLAAAGDGTPAGAAEACAESLLEQGAAEILESVRNG